MLFYGSNFLNAQCANINIRGTIAGAMTVTNNPENALVNTPIIQSTPILNPYYVGFRLGYSGTFMAGHHERKTTQNVSFNVVVKQGYKGKISNINFTDYVLNNIQYLKNIICISGFSCKSLKEILNFYKILSF
jgi:hypothetical protein